MPDGYNALFEPIRFYTKVAVDSRSIVAFETLYLNFQRASSREPFPEPKLFRAFAD
jgi:hypothetical protein